MEESKHINTEKNTTVQIKILSISLCCETWTLTELLERIIIAFDHKAYRIILGIDYFERKTMIMYTKEFWSAYVKLSISYQQ